MDDTITLTFWIGGGVFIAVCLFMVYCVFKFSYKEGRKAEYVQKTNWENINMGNDFRSCCTSSSWVSCWNQYVNVPKMH